MYLVLFIENLFKVTPDDPLVFFKGHNDGYVFLAEP